MMVKLYRDVKEQQERQSAEKPLTREQVAELRRWFLARQWTYDMATEEHGATYTVVAATVPDDINALCDTIEELRQYAKIGEAVRRKLKTWLISDRHAALLRDDAQRIAFDLGESLCTVIADTIAAALEAEQEAQGAQAPRTP